MRWRIFMLVLLALFTVIFSMRLAAAPAHVGPPPKELSSEALVDYRVVSQTGDFIGPVDGVIIDTETGETLYIIVFLKDIYNFGRGAVHSPQDHFLLIPWQHIALDVANPQLVVDADTKFVKDAPVFNEPPDTSTLDWDAAVVHYWRE